MEIKEEYLNEEYIINENENSSFVLEDLHNPSEKDQKFAGSCNSNSFTEELHRPSKNTTVNQSQIRNSLITITKNKKPTPPLNLAKLREEQEKFKKRLQEAINSCRDDGNNAKKVGRFAFSGEKKKRIFLNSPRFPTK